MKIEQIYTGCLAQGAYYIESEGEAVVIDPLREIDPYVQKAARNGAIIKYVFETHFHADFVSGHLDLAKATGATIVYGPTAAPSFEAHIATDGEIFKIGKVTITALHTPGHTLESTCYLLKDEQGKELGLFSGDTLFIGDVGRPDLAQKADHITQEDLAGLLYDSLRSKIMPLPDTLIVYPAHGAGSACGKNMSKETTDTFGHQKQTNYALRADMSKQEFIKEVTEGLTAPPQYFPLNVQLNKQGYESINEVLKKGTHPLGVEAFEAAANETDALILDTRDPQTFAKGFIPNSINIGIDGNFAPWVGALIPDIKQTILIVAEEGRQEEVVTRLARVGYDYAIGYLKGGIDAWKKAGKEIDTIKSITATELAAIQEADANINVLDVRKQSEYEAEHIKGAVNASLDYINDSMQQVDKNNTWYVHCAGGYRSMIFISILKARGFDNLIDIKGGFKALKETGKFAITDFVCPNTML
ncbi:MULTISPECIES: MBL fold metallo-hydrolase [Niastella]|uniref:MBL fold metallo-hydrolase n=1 Tax=Niastella soli TaxID=2821487 RepID=A0ABS3YPZ0_9BACT|nr:MBL fold metallo-hydrolase [Niastella soli]MBO9199914.1 MBL fold metallo-hydrolase [Niastella soli]